MSPTTIICYLHRSVCTQPYKFRPGYSIKSKVDVTKSIDIGRVELKSTSPMLRQIYKANRTLFARLYPTTLVFKDGSTCTIRYHEPRHIIKFPLTLEECTDKQSKLAWQIRRRSVRTDTVETEKDEVKFDARKYLRYRKK